VLSPLAFIERLLPGMRGRGFGRIVAIGSMAVSEPLDVLQLSNAHRPGLVTAFKVLARKNAADGVTFNHVHPGRIGTERILGDNPTPEAAEAAAVGVPAGRLGTVEECASAALYLCSVQAAYVNGTSILVDGALTRGVS
jgi:3-oxoacyl-[acyl-carrier protein] reductase